MPKEYQSCVSRKSAAEPKNQAIERIGGEDFYGFWKVEGPRRPATVSYRSKAGVYFNRVS
jgi:hypothetical protein